MRTAVPQAGSAATEGAAGRDEPPTPAPADATRGLQGNSKAMPRRGFRSHACLQRPGSGTSIQKQCERDAKFTTAPTKFTHKTLGEPTNPGPGGTNRRHPPHSPAASLHPTHPLPQPLLPVSLPHRGHEHQRCVCGVTALFSPEPKDGPTASHVSTCLTMAGRGSRPSPSMSEEDLTMRSRGAQGPREHTCGLPAERTAPTLRSRNRLRPQRCRTAGPTSSSRGHLAEPQNL